MACWRRRRYDLEPDDHWSGNGDGSRVVVEEEDPALRWSMVEALQRAGYRTAACEGPGLDGRGRCPLVGGSGCALVEDADAVVSVSVAGDDAMQVVRETMLRDQPEVRVAVIVPTLREAPHAEVTDGALVWTGPLTRSAVVAAVDRALDGDAPGR
jgi:hypothetical protein